MDIWVGWVENSWGLGVGVWGLGGVLAAMDIWEGFIEEQLRVHGFGGSWVWWGYRRAIGAKYIGLGWVEEQYMG